MIDWINANKEWLFSGAGGAVVIAIAGVVTKLKFWKKTDTRLATATLLPQQKNKGDFHILFIDDETSFKVVEILKAAGWTSTSIVRDISTVDAGPVANADLIFVDIQGVGQEMGFKEGGLGLTQAIKKRHPNKYVVIYSAETRGNRFHESLKIADNLLSKTSDPYQFQVIVENFFEDWCKK